MQLLSDKSGSFSNGEISWENGDIREFEKKDLNEVRKLISTANTVSLSKIFSHYGLNLNEHNKKIACPFASHQGGREKTPSFVFYNKTNSYFCFGCKHGSTAVDFVSKMEGISKSKAASKILEIFQFDVDNEIIFDRVPFDERLKIIMQFSNSVRYFRNKHQCQNSELFIDNLCIIFDNINTKYNLNNEALQELVQNVLLPSIKKFEE